MRLLSLLFLSGVVFSSRRLGAEEVRWHARLAGVRALGEPQQRELGAGGAGRIGLEIPIGQVFGLQLGIGGMMLPSSNAPRDAAFAHRQIGFLGEAVAGLRLRPWGGSQLAGFWIDVNGGVGLTGKWIRPEIEASLGYDWRLSKKGRFDLGPFAGYKHLFQPKGDIRPEDGHLVWVGLHFALGRPPPPEVRRDRDGDGVYDDEDACPDVPGIRTNDPKTNGCPRSDRDGDGVYDDEDACPDVPGVRTEDPKTNGCPRSDRDGDGIPDEFDACPDVPGIATDDPKTNGCPKSSGLVRVVGARIVLDDVIRFDLDSPRVRHASWPLVQQIAEFIMANPDIREVDIEGHADQLGTEEYNLKLSKMRAESVKKLLISYGVEPDRVTTFGRGTSKLKEQGYSEEERQKNRRVEFTITRVRMLSKSPSMQQGEKK